MRPDAPSRNWPSTKAKQVLAAWLRIGRTIKRPGGTSHRILARPGWPDVLFAYCTVSSFETRPFNFAGATDTHGDNSGSPTVNTRGEVVGILFDGNLEKLPNEFVFTDVDSRSVHVASQGIIEALRKVYRADALVEEILGR